MGSSALPIGGAAVDRLLSNEATTLRRSSFRTTLIWASQRSRGLRLCLSDTGDARPCDRRALVFLIRLLVGQPNRSSFGTLKPSPKLVTFNGRSFDLPAVRHRAMVNRVPAAGPQVRQYFHRHTEDAPDLCDVSAAWPTLFAILGALASSFRPAQHVAQSEHWCGRTRGWQSHIRHL